MNNKEYICPRCGSDMLWTGYDYQYTNDNRWWYISYVYQCRNINCGYRSKYDTLDSAGEWHAEALRRQAINDWYDRHTYK